MAQTMEWDVAGLASSPGATAAPAAAALALPADHRAAARQRGAPGPLRRGPQHRGGLSKFYRKARSFSSLTDVELGGGTTEQLAKRERQRAGSEEPEPRSEGDGGGGGGARAPGTFARWALGRAGSEGESPASVSGGGSAGSMPGTPSLLDRGCGAQSMPVGGSISMWDTGGDDDAVVSQVRRVSDGSSSDAAAAASRKATGMQRADTPVVGEFGKDAASPFFWAFSQPRRSMEMLAEEDEQE